jgi:hypothetical protein
MNFEEFLLEAIDESFSWLGESEKRIIYFFLEKEYNIDKRDIPSKIDDFKLAIENIFGTGAKLLEIKIMKNLFAKMGYSFPYLHAQEGLEFTKYIDSAKSVGERPCSPVLVAQV